MRPLNLERIRHAVVVAPHSDDETIAALFTISALRRCGARVDIIIVTDGSASHRNSVTHPKSRRVAMRKSETCSAMQAVRVPRQRIAFLGLPDGGLRDLTTAGTREALQKMRARPRPDLLIIPSMLDDHPDHRVVAGWCDRAWPASVARLRYIVWPSATRPRTQARILGGRGDAAAKRAALRRYRSQTGEITDDPYGFCLTADMIHRMCKGHERFTC